MTLARGRAPHYGITEEYPISVNAQTRKVLPAGSFVRPINIEYVPKHILKENPDLNQKIWVFCYTHYGIVPIPREIVEEKNS